MTVTEVGCMGVKPGLRVMDQTKPEGAFLAKAYKTVTTTEHGPYNAFWGLEIDNPSMLWAFFEFDSVEQHQKFARLHGAEIVKDLPNLLTHGEFMKHISFTPSPFDVLRSPLVEIMLVHFPGTITEASKAYLLGALEKVLEAAFRKHPGVAAISSGWSVENDFPIRGEEGQVGSVLAAAVGWYGPELQASFRQTKDWEVAQDEIKALEGVLNVTSLAVNCRGYKRMPDSTE